ncbi:response regulator [Bacteriovorax sp. Seq25_V]|uniref:response regulator n=1 Tax=Bacteriovorax sp. Seq25_V TaxID=1201288 RepID=UPI00038A4E08|nr:response regulator [Bacteriovorax sp. Seq25_V]EQC46839.1 response regulator receiver domain protein [Bacteriovorax sp. Seq25_V]
MTKKIIVADDSQTIQKVIKITFGSKGYELISVLSESELYNKISSDADLLLLDFSLSETKSGYELAKAVREKNKTIPIMALLGTFDTIDESQFVDSGFADKVVKPFETDKFIRKCEALLSAEVETATEVLEEESDDETDFSDWDINSPQVKESEAEIEELEEFSADASDEIDSNDLDNELGGWGFSKDDLAARDLTNDYPVYPPVIEESKNIASKFLSANTLVEEVEDEDYTDSEDEVTKEISLDELESLDAGDSHDELEALSEEDIESSDFWSVDEVLSEPEEVSLIAEEEIDYEEEETEAEPLVNNDFHYNVMEGNSSPMVGLSTEELKEALKEDLSPIVHKYVDQYCRENIEKIMWDIIPDLAENIIKKELKNISKEVLSSIDN